jgi:hypothetical protein
VHITTVSRLISRISLRICCLKAGDPLPSTFVLLLGLADCDAKHASHLKQPPFGLMGESGPTGTSCNPGGTGFGPQLDGASAGTVEVKTGDEIIVGVKRRL